MSGPGWCSNLVKNILTHFLEGPTPGNFCLKNSPLSRNSDPAERKRPGRGGGILNMRHNNNLVDGNIMHCVDLWRRSAHNSYTDTPTTQVTAWFKLGRKMFLNSIGTNTVLRNG